MKSINKGLGINAGLTAQAGLVGGFSPLFLPNLQMWYDASDTSTITQSSGSVSQIDDKSGNSRHATQGVGSSQPTTGIVTIGGKNALDFDGSDFLSIADFTYNLDEQTVFIVGDFSATASEQYTFCHYDTSGNQRGWAHLIDSSNRPVTAMSSAGTFPTTNVTDITGTVGTSPIALSYRWDNTGLQDFYKDGVASDISGAPQAASIHDSTSDILIGARRVGGSAATFTTGAFAEVIMYDKYLSSDDIARVHEYLINKWGL